MLDLCRAGQIDYIVIKDVARYARNTVDSLQIARELRSLNPPVGIYFETLNFDTLRNDYEMLLGVMSMCCQLESQQKSEAMLWSLKHRFEGGHFLCPTNNLLGYITVDGMMTIEEEGAKTVRLIFYMYLAGYSAQEIADIMTEAKRKTGWTRRDKDGKEIYNYKWSSGTVLNILRNERYCGDVRAQKTYTVSYLTHEKRKNNGEMPFYDQEHHHEGIVSQEVYQIAQKIIASNKYKAGSGKIELSLSVIPKGLLRGFIPMNRMWAGSDVEEYINVSDSIGWDDVKPQSINLPCGISGMEIMRTDYTVNQAAPYITLTYSGLDFNMQCRRLMDGVEYVELLLHPKEKLLAIRACLAENPNAIKWAEWSAGKCKLKAPGVGYIPKVIYDVMNWNMDWKFRASGEFRCREKESVLVFSLEETAAYIPIMQADEYDEDHFMGWNKPIYPYEWREQIVGPVLIESITKCRMHLCDYFDMWEVSTPAVSVVGHERAIPKTREEILEEIEKLDPEKNKRLIIWLRYKVWLQSMAQ